MASIQIKITEEEKLLVIQAVRKLQGKTVSVAKIASSASMNPNRVRFIVEDLLEENRIKRTPTKVFNPRYIRYSYEVVK